MAVVHLVRNAIDHGIECPAVRRQQGKPEKGRVRIRADEVAGNAHIVVEDDGGGIDLIPGRLDRADVGGVGAERSHREGLHATGLGGSPCFL